MIYFCFCGISVLVWGKRYGFSFYFEFKVFEKLFDVFNEGVENFIVYY